MGEKEKKKKNRKITWNYTTHNHTTINPDAIFTVIPELAFMLACF